MRMRIEVGLRRASLGIRRCCSLANQALAATRDVALLLVLTWSCVIQAAVYTYTYSGQPVELPDGGGVGLFVEQDVTGLVGKIAQATVWLDISGTWSGDIYAYLNLGTDHAVLLNRVGKTASNVFGEAASARGGRLWWARPTRNV